MTTLPPQQVAQDLAALIGNTPMIRIDSTRPEASVYAKLERFNPLSSAKDRIALAMLDGAEERRELAAGGTVIEATSGNTGIALAALSGARGYRCTIVMPDSASTERIEILRAFGARIELTPASSGYQASIDRALEIHASTPNSWFACQHDNADNVRAHYTTTAPELWQAMGGAIDVLVCGVGTGGTISGIGRYLKEQNPAIQVVAVEPAGSPVLTTGQGGQHGIPGWNGGFVAPTTDTTLLDAVMTVTDDEARSAARELMRAHGLFVGISSGGAYHAARAVAAADPRLVVATIFPDTGERYLSILTSSHSSQENFQ